jgi:polyhydroxyalkanoate synthesis regulator phasin
MKTKTIIELLTLSSSLYVMARDAQILDKLGDISEKGKDNINKFMTERQLDENGNEMEFVEHIIAKVQELKEQLNEKIESQVVSFYKKINVAHLDEIKALNEKLEKLDATVALLEARVNHLEQN